MTADVQNCPRQDNENPQRKDGAMTPSLRDPKTTNVKLDELVGRDRVRITIPIGQFGDAEYGRTAAAFLAERMRGGAEVSYRRDTGLVITADVLRAGDEPLGALFAADATLSAIDAAVRSMGPKARRSWGQAIRRAVIKVNG